MPSVYTSDELNEYAKSRGWSERVYDSKKPETKLEGYALVKYMEEQEAKTNKPSIKQTTKTDLTDKQIRDQQQLDASIQNANSMSNIDRAINTVGNIGIGLTKGAIGAVSSGYGLAGMAKDFAKDITPEAIQKGATYAIPGGKELFGEENIPSNVSRALNEITGNEYLPYSGQERFNQVEQDPSLLFKEPGRFLEYGIPKSGEMIGLFGTGIGSAAKVAPAITGGALKLMKVSKAPLAGKIMSKIINPENVATVLGAGGITTSQEYEGMRNKGVSPLVAAPAATVSGLLQGALETIGIGGSVIAKRAINNPESKQIAKTLVKTVLDGAKEIGKNIIGESTTEAGQQGISDIVTAIATGKGTTINDIVKNAVTAGVLAIPTATIMSGGHSILKPIEEKVESIEKVKEQEKQKRIKNLTDKPVVMPNKDVYIPDNYIDEAKQDLESNLNKANMVANIIDEAKQSGLIVEGSQDDINTQQALQGLLDTIEQSKLSIPNIDIDKSDINSNENKLTSIDTVMEYKDFIKGIGDVYGNGNTNDGIVNLNEQAMTGDEGARQDLDMLNRYHDILKDEGHIDDNGILKAVELKTSDKQKMFSRIEAIETRETEISEEISNLKNSNRSKKVKTLREELKSLSSEKSNIQRQLNTYYVNNNSSEYSGEKMINDLNEGFNEQEKINTQSNTEAIANENNIIEPQKQEGGIEQLNESMQAAEEQTINTNQEQPSITEQAVSQEAIPEASIQTPETQQTTVNLGQKLIELKKKYGLIKKNRLPNKTERAFVDALESKNPEDYKIVADILSDKNNRAERDLYNEITGTKISGNTRTITKRVKDYFSQQIHKEQFDNTEVENTNTINTEINTQQENQNNIEYSEPKQMTDIETQETTQMSLFDLSSTEDGNTKRSKKKGIYKRNSGEMYVGEIDFSKIKEFILKTKEGLIVKAKTIPDLFTQIHNNLLENAVKSIGKMGNYYVALTADSSSKEFYDAIVSIHEKEIEKAVHKMCLQFKVPYYKKSLRPNDIPIGGMKVTIQGTDTTIFLNNFKEENNMLSGLPIIGQVVDSARSLYKRNFIDPFEYALFTKNESLINITRRMKLAIRSCVIMTNHAHGVIYGLEKLLYQNKIPHSEIIDIIEGNKELDSNNSNYTIISKIVSDIKGMLKDTKDKIVDMLVDTGKLFTETSYMLEDSDYDIISDDLFRNGIGAKPNKDNQNLHPYSSQYLKGKGHAVILNNIEKIDNKYAEILKNGKYKILDRDGKTIGQGDNKEALIIDAKNYFKENWGLKDYFPHIWEGNMVIYRKVKTKELDDTGKPIEQNVTLGFTKDVSDFKNNVYPEIVKMLQKDGLTDDEIDNVEFYIEPKRFNIDTSILDLDKKSFHMLANDISQYSQAPVDEIIAAMRDSKVKIKKDIKSKSSQNIQNKREVNLETYEKKLGVLRNYMFHAIRFVEINNAILETSQDMESMKKMSLLDNRAKSDYDYAFDYINHIKGTWNSIDKKWDDFLKLMFTSKNTGITYLNKNKLDKIINLLSSVMYFGILGGAVIASGYANLSQNMNTIVESGINNWKKSVVNVFKKEGEDILDELTKSNMFNQKDFKMASLADAIVRELGGEYSPTNELKNRLSSAWMQIFNTTEVFNRSVSALSFYYKGVELGLTGDALHRFTEEGVEKTQFDNSMSGQGMASINYKFLKLPMQFKGFMFKQINFLGDKIYDMFSTDKDIRSKAAKDLNMLFVGYTLIGGLAGNPLAGLMSSIMQFVEFMMGISGMKDLQDDYKSTMISIWTKLPNVAKYGLPGALGVDMSKSVDISLPVGGSVYGPVLQKLFDENERDKINELFQDFHFNPKPETAAAIVANVMNLRFLKNGLTAKNILKPVSAGGGYYRPYWNFREKYNKFPEIIKIKFAMENPEMARRIASNQIGQPASAIDASLSFMGISPIPKTEMQDVIYRMTMMNEKLKDEKENVFKATDDIWYRYGNNQDELIPKLQAITKQAVYSGLWLDYDSARRDILKRHRNRMVMDTERPEINQERKGYRAIRLSNQI